MRLVENGQVHHNKRTMTNFLHYKTLILKLTGNLGLKKSLLVILTCLLILPNSRAQVNPLMACLGQEELRIHRTKTFGPVYFLNQLFISELATIYGLTLKTDVLDEVCQSKDFSPSVKLLKVLLLQGRSAFDIPTDANLGGVKALAASSLTSFLDRIPHVFFTYLSKLQALTPKAKCLEQKISEIAYFMERFKYLEDAVGTRKLIEEGEEKKVISIFKKLQRFDLILKQCKKRSK